jgi:hypothetical protein
MRGPPYHFAEGVVQGQAHDGLGAYQGNPGAVAVGSGFGGLRDAGMQGLANGATVGAEQGDAGAVDHVDGMQLPVAGQCLFKPRGHGTVVGKVQAQRQVALDGLLQAGQRERQPGALDALFFLGADV